MTDNLWTPGMDVLICEEGAGSDGIILDLDNYINMPIPRKGDGIRCTLESGEFTGIIDFVVWDYDFDLIRVFVVEGDPSA